MSMHPVDIAPVVERCTWCGISLTPHLQVVIAGGRFAGGSARLEELRGHIVQVQMAHAAAPVTAIVPLPDTPAHQAGYDLLFVLCSAACRDALDAAIGDEAMILSIADAPPTPRISHTKAVTAPQVPGPTRLRIVQRQPS